MVMDNDTWINALWPSDAIPRHETWSTVFQVMARLLIVTKLSPEPMLFIINQINSDTLQYKKITNIFGPENALQNVICNIPAILLCFQTRRT